MIYTSKNTRFNRQANLLEKTIQIIERKNGLAYFAILGSEGKNTFCVCEEALFDKEFSPVTDADIPSVEKILDGQSLDVTKIAFKRYPIDLKG